MRRGRIVLWLLLVPILWGGVVGCNRMVVPHGCRPCAACRGKTPGELEEHLRRDWHLLGCAALSAAGRNAAVLRYNANLLCLLEKIRYDARKNKGNLPLRVCAEGGRSIETAAGLTECFCDPVPARQVRLRELKERYTTGGIGVPVVGIMSALRGVSASGFRGSVCTLTVVSEFPERGSRGRMQLRLVSPLRQPRLRIGRVTYSVAADFSAPLEVYWGVTRVGRQRFLGLLRPHRMRGSEGLLCPEPYDARKVPVVFVHGLASSAATFANLVNRLQKSPKIRQHYQFWYYNYPTGVAWPLIAVRFRRALQAARLCTDPQRCNANWNRMVLVGHSMGGLIVRYELSRQPWRLFESVPGRQNPFAGPALQGADKGVRALFPARALKVGQVVYMATPHRGAPIAGNRLVLLLADLIRLPAAAAADVFHSVTVRGADPLAIPHRIIRRLNSVRQLSPGSYAIRSLSTLPLRRVPTHSVIGDRGYHNSPRSSDGIVPYWSSHLPYGTETIVPSDHGVQEMQETAEALSRILLRHAAGM